MDCFLFLEVVKALYVPAAIGEHLFGWDGEKTSQRLEALGLFSFLSPFSFPNYFLRVGGECIMLITIRADEASMETSKAIDDVSLWLHKESILPSTQGDRPTRGSWFCLKGKDIMT